MTDYITLTCPSCGAKLEVTEDIGQFACAHCGREHILYQAGGIVALKPLVEGIKNIEAAVDGILVDMACNRLDAEIEELTDRKNQILTQNPCPMRVGGYLVLISIGILAILLLLIIFMERLISFHTTPGILVGIPAVIVILVLIGKKGFVEEFYNQRRHDWEVTTGPKIRELDEQIKTKKVEKQQLNYDESIYR